MRQQELFTVTWVSVNGDGLLIYPGKEMTPLPSIRLEVIRDGVEDYEYLVLLEQAAGDEAVKGLVDRIAPNWWQYCREPSRLLEVRRELAERIVQSRAKSD